MRIARWFIVDLTNTKALCSFGNLKDAEAKLAEFEIANPDISYKITCKWGNI